MARYNFVSPGAAAGAGIQEVLTQAREEERQRLLDEITRQNAEMQRQATEQNIKQSTQQMELTELGEFDKSFRRGAKVTDPRALELGRKYGRVGPNPNPTPSVSTSENFSPILGEGGPIDIENTPGAGLPSEMPAPPTDLEHSYWRGSPEEQEREERQAAVGRYIAGLPPDVAARLGPGAELAAAMGMESLPSSFFTANDKRSLYDPNSRQFIDVPAGTSEVSVVPWQPRDPTPKGFQMPGYTSPAGYPLTFDPNTNKMYEHSPTGVNEYGGTMAPRPTNNSQALAGSLGIPAAIFTRHITAVTKTASGGILGMGGASQADLTEAQQATQALIASASRVPMDIKSAVTQVMAPQVPDPTDPTGTRMVPNPYSDYTAEELKQMQLDAGTDPLQADVFYNLLIVARGR